MEKQDLQRRHGDCPVRGRFGISVIATTRLRSMRSEREREMRSDAGQMRARGTSSRTSERVENDRTASQ
jgi:hypothetical protein